MKIEEMPVATRNEDYRFRKKTFVKIKGYIRETRNKGYRFRKKIFVKIEGEPVETRNKDLRVVRVPIRSRYCRAPGYRVHGDPFARRSVISRAASRQ